MGVSVGRGRTQKGGVDGVGGGLVRAIPDVVGLLLTGNSVSDCWTPWLFIDPCSSFLCLFRLRCRFPSVLCGLAPLLDRRDPFSVAKIF